MVAICKSIYVVYRTNSTHKFYTQILTLRFIEILLCGENGWRVSLLSECILLLINSNRLIVILIVILIYTIVLLIYKIIKVIFVY